MSNKVILLFNGTTNLLLFLSLLYLVNSRDFGSTNDYPKFNTTSEMELLKRIKGADIKSWMNLEIDPCENFYDYVCGNWNRIHAVQMRKVGSVSKFDLLSAEMENRIKKFITSSSPSDSIRSKIHDFYESCRNTKKYPTNYKAAILELRDEFGIFSFHKRDNNSNFNWWTTIANIRKMFGMSMIIDINVGYHFKSRNKSMIFMDQPGALLSEDKIHETNRFLCDIIGVSPQDAIEFIENIYKFDDSLREIINSYAGDFVEEQFTVRNVTDLKEQYKDVFDVELFLKIAFNLTEVPEQIYVENCEYFDKLLQVLNSTNPQTVQDYILWHMISDFVVDDNSEDIDSVCIGITKRYFTQYLEHVIYQEFRSKQFEMEFYVLWHKITEVFRDDLQSKTTYAWMSNATKEEAIKKLNNIKLRIDSYDDINFEKFFEGLRFTSSNYVHNLRNTIENFESWRGTKLDIRSDTMADINQAAYTPIYNHEHNTITIPVSTFLPFRQWHPAYPKSILYSELGNTLAHELIHAFDDSNRQYDALGNAIRWWDDNSIRAYNEKRHCFQAQYHQYTLKGNQVRNMTDQSENISDNAAVRIAFVAYERWLSKNTNVNASELFRNLPFNGEELYFINFGQSNCEAITRTTLTETMESDTHAPDMLRVIVPLSNYPKFSEVFKCDANAFMNPENKCELY